MIDTGTGMAALALALGGKELIAKLLGPTAEYLGNEIQTFAAKRVKTVGDIFSNASKKLGSKIESEAGGVAPKVLKGILDEGSYAQDGFTVEYFGGVLASSRSGISRDDRGAYMNALIGRLSTYQIRTHYIVYRLIKELFDGQKINVGFSTERGKLRIFIPFDVYLPAMDMVDEEMANFTSILIHTVIGLSREELISDQYRFGKADHIKHEVVDAQQGGIVVAPSAFGFELFMWAHGQGSRSVSSFLDPDVRFGFDTKIEIGDGVKVVKPIK